MVVNNAKTKKLFVIILATLFLILLAFFLYNVLQSYFSLASSDLEVWDGTSISSSFSLGNGTKDNPYVINNGSDLNYFKSLIEGDNYSNYSDKYYVLGNDIDLGNNNFQAIGTFKETLRIFNGHFDGAGHTIKNITILSTEIQNIDFYGLFSIVDRATIKNLNLEGIKITATSDINYLIGSLCARVDSNNNISNVSIINSIINTTSGNNECVVAGLTASIGEENTISNIFIDSSISSDIDNKYNVVGSYQSNLENIVYIDNDYTKYGDSSNNSTIVGYAATKNNDSLEISLDGKVIDNASLLDTMNTSMEEYYFDIVSGSLRVLAVPQETALTPSFFSFGNSDLLLYDSGVIGDTLYINDLDSDLNYYKGLNYTYSSGPVLPTGANQDLYNTSNLAKLYIQYNGTDLKDESLTGYVSLTEQISKINYYKYYKVENGYVSIPLIDNPFADRPDNLVFNGWITNYQGVNIRYDKDVHVYYADIAITDISAAKTVIFYASWANGKISEVNNNNWDTAFNNFNPAGLINVGKIRVYEDVSNYYIQDSAGFWENYPNNAVNNSGNRLTGRCRTWGGCAYYAHPSSGTYDASVEYYKLVNRNMTLYEVSYTLEDDPNGNTINDGDPVGGYYREVNLTSGNSLQGYYDAEGNYLTGGSCNNASCKYYELIPFCDASGAVNVATADGLYYQLVTRDSNIAVLRGTNNTRFSTVKPFTLTSINNGVDYNGTYNISNTYISTAADLRIEHITLRTSTRASASDVTGNSNSNANSYIYGNFHNLKIGRGIKQYGNNQTAFAVIGGNNSDAGSSDNIERYQTIIESGHYNGLSLVGGYKTGIFVSTSNYYVEAQGIYGSDIDRIKGDNTSLQVYGTAAGSWGGYVRGATDNSTAIMTNVKSGSFGTSKNDYTSGIYVGGIQSGTHYAVRRCLIEGGYIYNLLGGPITDSTREGINDIFINVKGGSIDFIVGGAGRTETYGNRIVNVTGGTINHAVFGGSNGYIGDDSSNNRGTLKGNTLVYVGGTSTVGSNEALSGNSIYGAEIGSIFGIGNGNSDYDMIGTATTSKVIIDGEAVINTNVYGGGNYGAVGIENTSGSSATDITILGGTIKGSVYGGGNNNGAGSSNISTKINILMSAGVIEGSLYGGSKTKGTVYGDSNVSILGGKINGSVYGGGEGGYTDNNSVGTFVTGGVNVVIGNGTNATTLIGNNVYGGSAFGTVNGAENSDAVASKDTLVTVNSGTINGSLFGGGQGSTTFTPYVLGNVVVTVNGGNIGNVYGGCDAAGSPNGTSNVYLNGGIIGNSFGGGNNTGQKASNIYLQGATTTNLFGGSNSSGTVPTTNVIIASGTVGNVYGGNNLGGTTETNNINVTGGTINGDIYGGGSLADTKTSNVNISSVTVRNVYGGGEKASVDTTSIIMNGTSGQRVFGGSNISGDVITSDVTATSVSLNAIYGGNNAGGTTGDTTVTINSGTITEVYGGGDKATALTSNIKILAGTISNIYGGGNNAGLTTSTVNVYGGTATNVFGGSNSSGNITTSNVQVGVNTSANQYIDLEVTPAAVPTESWQNQNYSSYIPLTIKLTNKTDAEISDWKIKLQFPATTVVAEDYTSSNISIIDNVLMIDSINKYYGYNSIPAGGSFTISSDSLKLFSTVNPADFKVRSSVLVPNESGSSTLAEINVTNVYGGNNIGGITSDTNVTINGGVISSIYGGGNLADVGGTNVIVREAQVTNLYGGGNKAKATANTYLDIDNSLLQASVYGGGNEGEVSGNTEIYVTDTIIKGSLYAGGNGSTALVTGNTTVYVDGKTEVGSAETKAPYYGCIFGGGNAAATGTELENSSIATVNIAGGVVHGNVYGGANTSVVYGATKVNIGNKLITDKTLNESDIVIKGTVFGGGESNAEGNEEYDFSFLSVIGSIDVNIDGTGYLDNNHQFNLSGSIFGSGNASSSQGTSTISVKKLGTRSKPSKNISFQRTNLLTIDESVIELEGIEDRTNDYSDIKYSFNQIDSLTIKNNTVLLLQRNANMLKEFYSGVDVNGNLQPATVTIDDNTKTVTKNVDNRIYILTNRNLNIATNQDATSYGKVTGMTFFGMYNSYSSGSLAYGVYDMSFNYGDAADAGDVIVGGSYVLGLHSLNHNIEKDGFYTNVLNDDFTEVVVEYIDPTPDDTNYYRWIVGTSAINYNANLTASKYSSLGTANVSLYDFAGGDTIFNVIGFNSEGLGANVSLVDQNDVPAIAKSEEEANKLLGLSLKAETREWTGYGTTKFLSKDGGNFTGTEEYKTDSQKVAPSLMLYLYHAKNITLEQNLGTVVITLRALTPINEIEYKTQLVTITVEITAHNFDDGNSYDASITYNKKYEMPSATMVNITNQSQFTAYYSLFATADKFMDLYGVDNTNYHALVSNYALPVGTQITMIDYGVDNNQPQYYYFDVTEEVYNSSTKQLTENSEAVYKLSDFIKMGSISNNNTYNDADCNTRYFSEEYKAAMEEFIFIFDFKETKTTGEHLNNSILLELRNKEARTVISVLGIRQSLMVYNLFDSTNAVLEETITSDNYLYYDMPSSVTFESNVAYDQTDGRDVVIDTNYESSSMGLNIYMYDSSNNQVSSTLLAGTIVEIGNISYYVDGDGVYRIKLANKVSNLKKNMYILSDNSLPVGIYTLKFVLFASSDGLHNSSFEDAAVYETTITVVGDDNALVVTTDNHNKIVDGDTSLNMNNTNINKYTITNHSVLENPNIRVTIYKRDIGTEDSTLYAEVPFESLFSNTLENATGESGHLYEKLLAIQYNNTTDLELSLNNNLVSGTYKVCFRLYDSNQLIEEEIQYVIVKKKIETG